MKELHIFYAPDIETTHELPQEEATHAVRVLRMSEGDSIRITDGKGHFFDGTITLASNKHCCVDILAKHKCEPLWAGKIHLAVAPTKNMDRIEWFAEKATEIGLDEIHFLCCTNSERKVIKTERIEKIVVAATKQSHKAVVPIIHEMKTFQQFIAHPFDGQKFIAHCYDEIPDTENYKPFLKDLIETESNKPAIVLIGPEGDFSVEEVKLAISKGYQPIHLGKSRLRTETAALVAVHLMNLAKQYLN